MNPPSKKRKRDPLFKITRPLGRRPHRGLTGYSTGRQIIPKKYSSLTFLQDDDDDWGEEDFLLDQRILHASSRRTQEEKAKNPPVENDTTDMRLDAESMLFITKKWQGAYSMLNDVVNKEYEMIPKMERSALKLIQEVTDNDETCYKYKNYDGSLPTIFSKAVVCLADVAMLLGEYIVDVFQTKGIRLPGSRVARMYLDYNFVREKKRETISSSEVDRMFGVRRQTAAEESIYDDDTATAAIHYISVVDLPATKETHGAPAQPARRKLNYVMKDGGFDSAPHRDGHMGMDNIIYINKTTTKEPDDYDTLIDGLQGLGESLGFPMPRMVRYDVMCLLTVKWIEKFTQYLINSGQLKSLQVLKNYSDTRKKTPVKSKKLKTTAKEKIDQQSLKAMFDEQERMFANDTLEQYRLLQEEERQMMHREDKTINKKYLRLGFKRPLKKHLTTRKKGGRR